MNYVINCVIRVFLLLIIIQNNALSNEEKLKKILDTMESRYEMISNELGNSYWDLYTNSENVNLNTPKQKFKILLMNDTLNSLIYNWQGKIELIKDGLLAKRVETWYRILQMAKVEYDDEIMQLRNELEHKLKVSNEELFDEESLEHLMIKLAKLRNRKSIELGYDNYVELTFEVNGLGYDWFTNFVDSMYLLTDKDYTKLVNNTKHKKDIETFAYSDFNELFLLFYNSNNPDKVKANNIDMVKETLNNIGFEFDSLPALLIEKQLPAGIGGQGLMINIPNEFKAVITNGLDIHIWMHEMGHGLQGLFCDINYPILEGYEWVPGSGATCFAEGMAETSAYFTRNFEWQVKYTNQDRKLIFEKKQEAKNNSTAFIRYWLYKSMREVEFYLNPDKSYQLIQEELMRKYLLVDNEFKYEPIASMRYVSYPLYLQNYLIADMIACQVHASLENIFGHNYCFNKKVKSYLVKNFYSTGEYYNWKERLEKGTGSKLKIKSYLNHYEINCD